MRDLKIYACGVDVPEGYELTKEEEDKLAQDNAEHENGLRVNQILYKSGFKAGQDYTQDECLSEARSLIKVTQVVLDSFLSNIREIRTNERCSDESRALAADVQVRMEALSYLFSLAVGDLT